MIMFIHPNIIMIYFNQLDYFSVDQLDCFFYARIHHSKRSMLGERITTFHIKIIRFYFFFKCKTIFLFFFGQELLT